LSKESGLFAGADAKVFAELVHILFAWVGLARYAFS
jgi:hypothetical protein